MVDNLTMETFGKSLWQAMQEGAEEMARMSFQDISDYDHVKRAHNELSPLTTYPDLDPGARLYEEPREFNVGDVWLTRHGKFVTVSNVLGDGVLGKYVEYDTEFHWTAEGRWINLRRDDDWDLVEKVEPDFNNLVLVDVEATGIYHKGRPSKVEEITWTDMAEMSPPGKHVSEIFPWYPASVSVSPRVKHEKALEKQWAEATPEERILGEAVANTKGVSYAYTRY